MSKLSARQAVAWAAAEITVLQIKAKLDAAKDRCQLLRDRYEARLEPSTDPDDAGKDVKTATAAGWLIRFTRYTGGERFALSAYRKAGHDITPEMAEHISPGPPIVRVTVKRIAGPTKPGAVERTS